MTVWSWLTITSIRFLGDFANTFTIRTATVPSPDVPIHLLFWALLASFYFKLVFFSCSFAAIPQLSFLLVSRSFSACRNRSKPIHEIFVFMQQTLSSNFHLRYILLCFKVSTHHIIYMMWALASKCTTLRSSGIDSSVTDSQSKNLRHYFFLQNRPL